ncbi:MAG: UDP-N-acetylmuramoyl-tripeptide--D-alanyl-D-alanine ligase [Clostridia bacterium]|nr:UDP-N-acetylmuramoyl-tripeptide--D-alanyl-D-alanine ligase [Clostridia bacterium]
MLNIYEIQKASEGTLLNGDGKKNIKNYSIDSRIIDLDDFFIPLIGERSDAHDYIIDCVCKGISGFFINSNHINKEHIVNESIKVNSDICIIEVLDTKRALLEIGRYNRQKHIEVPIVAVTGSVGKTSTREIISSVLETKYNVLKTEKNYNSDIGLPIMLLKIEDQEICVLEVGIGDVGEMEPLSYAIIPDIAIITMIGTAHIGVIGSQEKIFEEKVKITSHIKHNGKLILNGDDKYLQKLDSNREYEIIKYVYSQAENIKYTEEQISFSTKIYDKDINVTLNAIGNHNVYNALCAIRIGEIYKIPVEDIVQGLSNYKNFGRRMEKIRLKDNILFIDDAYNASFDSVKSGLNSLENLNFQNKIVVIGDILEQGEYAQELHIKIGELFKNTTIDRIFAFGKNSRFIIENANQYVNSAKWYDNKDTMIKDIYNNITSNTVVYFKASNGMRFDEVINCLKQRII